jgi:hypothetical protein
MSRRSLKGGLGHNEFTDEADNVVNHVNPVPANMTITDPFPTSPEPFTVPPSSGSETACDHQVTETKIQNTVYAILWKRANLLAIILLILVPFALLATTIVAGAEVSEGLIIVGGSVVGLFLVGNMLRWTIAMLIYSASTVGERVRVIAILLVAVLLCISTGAVWQCIVTASLLWFLQTKLMGDPAKVEAEITIKRE